MYRVVCCRFYLTAVPFVANLSGAVRARDVMVNIFELQVQKKPRRALNHLIPKRSPLVSVLTINCHLIACC
ncbi:hypothetical protein E9160_28605 [Klebsiella pneumoniae]|uniref:Secreted protein n=1 Tax=Klebsiella pneumoniae TaxID=573 RepID=A0A483VZT6_KLEPN|nr:hypothetical protein [Salmonella enterica]ECG6946091.1 hypothetical protein [Salmonella enterica subsp. enterica serovar Braenderup]EDD2874752.1 hypothetical protein [Salmonella enterica subsp. enterica serovar Stanley]EIW9131390.1 hypothetical protein [Klebsiella pneumoniae]THH51867.1 hypothetical protein E9165_29000 [Klebsiella pneumoniae subsp. pneumoniae]